MISMTMPQYRRCQCSVNGRVVSLSRQQTDLLSLLLLNYPRPMRREEMVEQMWPDPDLQPDTAMNMVAVIVTKLRQKIGRNMFPCRNTIGYTVAQHETQLQSPRSSANVSISYRRKQFVYEHCDHCGSRLRKPMHGSQTQRTTRVG